MQISHNAVLKSFNKSYHVNHNLLYYFLDVNQKSFKLNHREVSAQKCIDHIKKRAMMALESLT